MKDEAVFDKTSGLWIRHPVGETIKRHTVINPWSEHEYYYTGEDGNDLHVEQKYSTLCEEDTLPLSKGCEIIDAGTSGTTALVIDS